jgi:hypothetical protein
MKVEQVYSLVNDITKEILGESVILAEDLSNVVDVGVAIFNASDVDNYVKKLVDRIGRVVFVNRPYSGVVPSVLMDAWEFGSVLEKISADLPEAVENEAWNLQNGASYDPNVFVQPSVTVKFFNKKFTYEIDMSFTEMQVKESFTSASQLNSFLSMLYNAVDKSMTVKIDGLIMRTINYMIASTVKDDFVGDPGAGSGVKAINLLYLYNQKFTPAGEAALTADKAITSPEFIRFAAYTMGLYENRMRRISKLFNIEGKDRFTPSDLLHIVLLNDFKAAANAYLQSDTFHDEFTRLPEAETVPYWQGSGTAYAFADVSKISVKLNESDANATTISGVLGIMFDRDALGVCNQDRRVTTNYNPKGEFFTNFYKFDASAFVDPSEQAVVFFVADPAA